MKRKISAVLAAILAVATIAAPTSASAHDRRDGYYRDYRRDYRDHRDYRDYRDYRHDRYYDRRRHRDDDNDEIAAGVVGLVLGLALGAAASQPRAPRDPCYDNYRRCDGAQYDDRYGYAPPPSGYYEPYAPSCTRRERQWDRYAQRYVTVDVPC